MANNDPSYENPRDGNMPKAPTFPQAVASAAKRNKKKLVVGVVALVIVLVLIFNR